MIGSLQSLWGQFGSAHPIYSHALALLFGLFLGPRLLAWFEQKWIPAATDWIDSRQEKLLQRAGLTPDQILLIRQHEVMDLRKSADELEARIKAGTETPPKAA